MEKLNEKVQKPLLLVKLSKEKAEAQKTGKSFGFFESSKTSRFPRPTDARPNMVRSGRNRQGKPC